MATVIKAGNVASGAQITSDATGIITIATGSGAGTTAMTINDSQNVGINVASPTYRVEAYGSTPAFFGTNSTDGTRFGYTASLPSNSGNCYVGWIPDSVGTAGVNGDLALVPRTSAGANIRFFTGTTSASERMRITAAGNVGIGTTSPLMGLHLAASAGNLVYGGLDGNSNQFLIRGNLYYDTGNARSQPIATGWQTQIALDNSNGSIQFSTSTSSVAVGSASTITERMRVDASGNLLVGTTSAYAPITNTQIRVQAANAPGFLVMDRASVAVGSEIGRIVFGGDLSNNRYSSIAAFVPAGSPGVDFADLRFYTMAGGGSGPTERARIAADGKVSIGGSTENAVKLQIIGEGNTNSTFSIYCRSSTNTGRFAAGDGGTVYATATTISSISDQRLKENIVNLDVGLAEIMALQPRKFDWKEGQGKDIKGDRGFIAQEFEQVFPELIDEWIDAAPEGEEPYKSVRQDLIPVLVKAIQELKAELDATKAEVAALKGAAQ